MHYLHGSKTQMGYLKGYQEVQEALLSTAKECVYLFVPVHIHYLLTLAKVVPGGDKQGYLS